MFVAKKLAIVLLALIDVVVACACLRPICSLARSDWDVIEGAQSVMTLLLANLNKSDPIQLLIETRLRPVHVTICVHALDQVLLASLSRDFQGLIVSTIVCVEPGCRTRGHLITLDN